MNIQIFWKQKGLSKGEFNSVCQAVGGYEKLIDQNCKDKDLLALVTYIAEEDRAEKMLENQKIIKTSIVRNGKQATVGYQPDVLPSIRETVQWTVSAKERSGSNETKIRKEHGTLSSNAETRLSGAVLR